MVDVASEAIIGKNTVFSVETAAGSGVFFDLGEVVSGEAPSSSKEKVKVTHMQSPDNTHEYIPGLKDFAEIPIDLNWIPSNPTDAFILAWESGGERRSTRWTYPNGAIDTFPSYVAGYTGAIPLEDRMSATLTLQPAGARART